MPPVSEKQRRFMGAHMKDKGSLGQVAREYIGADPGGKLPKRAKQSSESRELTKRLGKRDK